MTTSSPLDVETLPAVAVAEAAAVPEPRGIHRLSLGAIVLAHIAVDMQTSSLAVLLPRLLTSFSLTYSSAAAIISANNIVIAIAQPLFGVVGDYRPARWLVPVGCAVCGLAMASVMFLPSYALVIVAVILSGLGSAAFHPEALSSVRVVSGEQKATGSAWFFFAGNLGFAFGPLAAAALLERLGTAGAAWMLAPVGLGLAALWTQRRWYTQSDPLQKLGVARLAGVSTAHRRQALGVVLFLLLFISVRLSISAGLQTFIPLYFGEPEGAPKLLSQPEIAGLLTIISTTGTLGTLLSGPLADRIGRRRVIVLSMALALAGLLVFLNSTGPVQWIALGLAGAMLSAPWTLSVIMMQEALPNNVGLASGLSLGTAYGAMGLGVAVLGKFADSFGLPMTMQLVVWLPAAVLLMGLFAPERREQ